VSIEQLSAGTMRVYPNPANDLLKVNTEGEDAVYSLIDIQGRIIKTGVISLGMGEIEVKDLPAGVYQLTVNAGNRQGQFKVQVLH
jgi:hypothetical protein